MAPEKYKAVATLDSEELSFVRRLFKNGDVKSDGRISVAEVVACVEQMDFIVDGPLEGLIRSVVPAAVEVDRLSLNDAIKVASAAKAQDKGSSPAPEAPSVGREDSLAELESSFIKQVMSGEIAADIIEEEPKAPSLGLGREDSLAQLESSFKKQVQSGNIPAAIEESPEGPASDVPAPNIMAVPVDIPKRRQSVTGGYPAAPSSPRNTPRGQVKRQSFSAMAGPEPVVVDDLPKRRSSVTRPGGGSLAGLQAESIPGTGIYDDDSSTMPATPELMKQSSEMQLLESAGSLSVEPVEASSVPKKRRSFTVSQSWLEAAAQERHPLEGADVSYEDINSREGKSWWQCLSCNPDPDEAETDGRGASSRSVYDDEDDAAVSSLKPEMWIKSAGASASTRSMDRPGKADVCSIS